jgi:hypothetical protein
LAEPLNRSRSGSSQSGISGGYYLTAVIATSLIVYVTMRDTKHASAMGRHE